MARRKPRTIPDEIIKGMTPAERQAAMRAVGAKRGYVTMSRGANRLYEARKVKARASEARGVKENMTTKARKLGTDEGLMREGKRGIEKFNEKRLTEKTIKGKRILSQGGEQRMKDLRRLLQEALDMANESSARKAARAAARLAKKLK